MSGHLSPAGDPNAILKVAQLHARAFCRFCFWSSCCAMAVKVHILIRAGHAFLNAISIFLNPSRIWGSDVLRERHIRLLATVLAVDFRRLYG